MARPIMIICLIADVLAVAAMGAGLGLSPWIESTSATTQIVGYTSLGMYQNCYTLSSVLTCVTTSSTTSTFLASKALTTIGAAITLAFAVTFVIVYLCQQRACGVPRRLLIAILIVQIIGVAAAGAGAGVFYGYYLSSSFGLGYAGYIFFGGCGLGFIAIICTLIEICLQQSDAEPGSVEPQINNQRSNGFRMPPPEREDSDVSVIIHQPYANPYAGYQPPGFAPATNNPYLGQLPPPAYSSPSGKNINGKDKTPQEMQADWANQVSASYQQYYQNYYQNYYQQRQQPGIVPSQQQPTVGPSAIQQQPIRTIFQQDDADRGGIKVVQMGASK